MIEIITNQMFLVIYLIKKNHSCKIKQKTISFMAPVKTIRFVNRSPLCVFFGAPPLRVTLIYESLCFFFLINIYKKLFLESYLKIWIMLTKENNRWFMAFVSSAGRCRREPFFSSYFTLNWRTQQKQNDFEFGW